MDNPTTLPSIDSTDLRPAAHGFYRLLNGQTLDDEASLACTALLCAGRWSMSREQQMALGPQLLGIFSDQPQTASLRQRWRRPFSCDSLSQAQASEFLRELFSSIEHIGRILDAPIVAGTTHVVQDQFSDYTIFRPHQKPGWTLHRTVSGHGDYNCVRQRLRSEDGDLLLFAPDALLDCRRHPDASHWTHQWICFQPRSEWLLWMQWPDVGPGVYRLPATHSPSQTQLATLFTEIVGLDTFGQQLNLDLRVNLLEQLLIRARQCAEHLAAPVVDTRIQSAMRHLHEHFNQPLRVEQLAAQVGLSASRFAILFKKTTGTSVVSWRDERRMARACQLLSQTRQPINRIADEVGYADPLYFTRCFHRRFGCSPQQFRRRQLAEE